MSYINMANLSDENKIDIGHGGPWPGNILSNMWPHPFQFGEFYYTCMESFLQSLKFEDPNEAARIRKLPNFEARREGQKGNGWKKTQKLYWDGIEIDRQSSMYNDIVLCAYEHMYEQNFSLQLGLRLTRDATLDHSIGVDDPENTILTRKDFVSFLYNLRERQIMTSNSEWKDEYKSLIADCVTLDTETTSVDTKEAEILQLAHTVDFHGEPANILYRSVKPIPPEASAIHHISNRMIRGLPTFGQKVEPIQSLVAQGARFYVAHNADFDKNVIINSCKRDGLDDEAAHFEAARWICTWRLAKAVLGVDYTKLQYNLSYLRYALDLDVPDDLPAHDGRADVIVCAKLFEMLVELAVMDKKIYPGQDLGEQLYDLCWQPKKVETWPFGKYKGQKLADIPTDFYMWAIDKVDSLQEGHENLPGR